MVLAASPILLSHRSYSCYRFCILFLIICCCCRKNCGSTSLAEQVANTLQMEFLHYSIAKALVDLVVYADSLAASGRLTKWRLIFPKWKRIMRFFTNVYSTRDLSQDTGTINDFQNGSHKIHLGESYYAKKDPEHLPPRNWFEAAGDGLLMIPKWLASPASAFGLRAACATMSLAIPLFIRQTQAFSSQNRLYWAIIMTAISMSPTSGQSIFGFILRVVGTIAAMLLSWIIYYVSGNGKTPGILVLYWFVVSLLLYIPIKRPAFAAGWHDHRCDDNPDHRVRAGGS